MSVYPQTQMRREILEIPDAVERLLGDGAAQVEATASAIRDTSPRFLLSVARGSSDHCATYLKYASELLLGLPMASVALRSNRSTAWMYRARQPVPLGLPIGQSPDTVSLVDAFTRTGAYSVAITNDATSPLANAATATLPIHAGAELSVAATKTFVTSLVAGIWLLAEIKQDAALKAAIRALPQQLEQAVNCDWSPMIGAVTGNSLYTLGRGPSLAISNEAALKFKETCLLHAESYSSAEVLHGPVSVVGEGFPVIAFAAHDAAEDSVAEVADAIAEKGARVFATTSRVKASEQLPHVRTDHWLTDPIALIASFYAMVENLAVSRGINPDTPRHLKKVTETV